MKRKIKYTNESMEDIQIIKDFLPSPKDLIFKEKNVRVTINLRKSSVDFFKSVAKTGHTKYQKIIRSVLDHYATESKKAS